MGLIVSVWVQFVPFPKKAQLLIAGVGETVAGILTKEKVTMPDQFGQGGIIVREVLPAIPG